MNVTWREQIVAYCVLFIARMFADDHQLKQDLKNLSNKITTAPTPAPAVPTARPGAITLDDLAGP
jgi:hypothetical protein